MQVQYFRLSRFLAMPFTNTTDGYTTIAKKMNLTTEDSARVVARLHWRFLLRFQARFRGV